MNQHGHENNISTVCIDAAEVKRIREGSQLTQLYVSKVVGVTTDTISRWENNRYPTIRRENAIKLAEALEVALEDILLKPVEDPVETASSAQNKPTLIWLVFAVVFMVALLALVPLLSKSPPPPAAVTAERILPDFAAPGSSVPVQVRLTYRAKSGGVILREYFPKGWKIVQAHPPASSLDNVHGIARWIIKAGENTDRVVYLVQVDNQAKLNTEESFQGEIVASREGSQSAVSTQGDGATKIASVHWADTNGDGHIDDVEMLEGSFTIEDMAGVHIDWNDLEKLWDAGSYTWDMGKEKFIPKVIQQ